MSEEEFQSIRELADYTARTHRCKVNGCATCNALAVVDEMVGITRPVMA